MTISTASTTTRFTALATAKGANARFLREWRAGRWPYNLSLPRVLAVRGLRLHPGSRTTLLYTVEGWPEAEVIAKVYARPHPPAAQILAPLLAAGFAAPGPYRVPEVIAELPALQLVLTRVAPGTPLTGLLRAGDLGAAARAGEWLRALHTAPITAPAAYTLRDPLARAARSAARLARLLPDLADQALSLHAALIQTRPAWPGDVRLIHGDLVAEHIFVAPEATTVIDWDCCRAGDAAEDAGRLVASLWHLAARGRITHGDAAAAERRIRAAYTADQPAIAAQVSFYAALAALHKASHLTRHGERGRDQAGALLATGLAALGGTG